MNQSRELSGALPQPDNSRQNSLGSGFQATLKSFTCWPFSACMWLLLLSFEP